MAEVLIDLDIQLAGPDGRTYGARACVLGGQLNALNMDQVANIVKAYGLSRVEPAAIDRMSRDGLVRVVMRAVEGR